MRLRLLFLLSITTLLFHSCALKQSHVLFEQNTSAIRDTQHVAPPAITAYRIQPDDILQIRNLQNIKYIVEESSSAGGGGSGASNGQSYQVEQDGTVTLPVIGHVDVVGLTRHEAAMKIEKLYRDSLLKNPIIELKIMNLKVTVLGETASQGNFTLQKDRTTLIDIIGQAGGLTHNANEKNIKIIRTQKDQLPITYYVDLSDIKTLTDPRIELQNNDIIYVAQNQRAIRDEKLQNFSTLVQPSLLIFNTALIIYTLFR